MAAVGAVLLTIQSTADARPCDVSGTWTKKYDFAIDGKIGGKTKENQIVLLASKKGALQGKYVGREKKNKSRFTGRCLAEKSGLIYLVQEDRAYRSVIVVSGNLSGKLAGTWHDTSGNSGDIAMWAVGAEDEARAEVIKQKAPPKKRMVAMSESDFAQLLRDIQRASFEDAQLGVVALAAKSNHFSCDQIGRLVDAISFSAGKVKVVEHTATRIVDPRRHHTILGHFTFSGDKRKAEEILARARTGH